MSMNRLKLKSKSKNFTFYEGGEEGMMMMMEEGNQEEAPKS